MTTPEDAGLRSELEERLRFETLISDLSSRFIVLPPGEVNREIEDAQRRVCELLGIDLSVLWQWPSVTAGVLTATHVYHAEGNPVWPEPLLRGHSPWYVQEVLAGRVVRFSSPDELPPEAAVDLEYCRRLGIESSLCLPLSVGGEPPVGALGFNTLRSQRDWPDALVKRLQLVAQIFTNALARSRADQTLRESEARLMAAVNAAGLGFYELRGVPWMAYLDETTRWMLGVPEDQGHRGREFWVEHLHSEDAEHVLDLSRRLLDGTSETVSVEYRYRHPRRGVVWLNHFARVVERNADGRAVRLLGVIQDVTDRKRNERQLRESEEFNRSVLASLVDGVAILDRDGVILAVNDEWERFARENAGPEMLVRAAVGTNYLEACLRAAALDVLDGIQSVLSGTRRVFRHEESHPSPAGARWFQVRVMPLQRPGSGAVIARTDITERRKADDELQQLRLQIWHADRVAQTGALTASLAHELNQPLAAILTNAQAGLRIMARESFDVGEVRDILADIVNDDKRAAAIISGLRLMLRRNDAERERISLEDTVQGVLRLLHSEMLGQSVQLRTHMESDGVVLADRTQIQQVVLNLVMNAVEAMWDQPPSRRRLDVTLTRAESGEALVKVRDSGPGIPEDQRGKMFEAFWTTKPHGIGIGLQISRSIIESHGGRLWFTDNSDQGVTFCFTLPRAIDRDSTPP